MCPLINPQFVAGLGPMCEKFPETPVVIDHCARIDAQHEKELADLCALAKHPNVHVKVSAFYAFGAKQPPYDEQIPRIKALYEAFGPRRLMWASDCPYQLGGDNTYAASIGLIHSIQFALSPALGLSLPLGFASLRIGLASSRRFSRTTEPALGIHRELVISALRATPVSG